MCEVKEYLTTEDIQRIFSLKSARAARALMGISGFPLMRLGKLYRVEPKALQKWIDQNSTKKIDIN